MSTYMKKKGTIPAKRTSSHFGPRIIDLDIDGESNDMAAAIFDIDDLASPLHYDVAQTALLLLDFQGFTVSLCGDAGRSALKKAKQMRDWALQNGVMVVHSVVDVNETLSPVTKGGERIKKMLDTVKNDREAVEEPSEVAFAQQNGEYVVLKPPGLVSGLKSHGATDLLREHKIKSLIICGLSTSGAVLRTAVPATDDGFVVSIIGDACADREDKHEWVLENVLLSRAHLASADEFIAAWQTTKGAVKGKKKA